MSALGLCLLVAALQGAPPLEPDYLKMPPSGYQETSPYQQYPFWRIQRPRWETGQLVLQGFFGASFFRTMQLTGGSGPDVDGSDEPIAQMPTIGGGGQYKLGGDGVDLGFEMMFSFSGRANAAAIAIGGGGATIAIKVDMFLFELYGGPFANVFLGDNTRVYASAGPVMEWADFTQQSESASIDDHGMGFGTGWYARTGIEFAMTDRTMIGFGVRWSRSTVDLDNSLGTLDLEGFQAVFTITEGF
jgi:opacity protein-like surface antigen